MFLSPYLLFSLPLLVSSAVKREVMSSAEVGKVLGSVEKDCQQKHNATRDDLILFHDLNHLKDTKEVKCMVACILETYGTLDEQDVPDVASWETYFKAQFKPEDQHLVMKIGMDCFTTVARKNILDHCDFVFTFVECFFDKINEEKIEKVKFFDL